MKTEDIKSLMIAVDAGTDLQGGTQSHGMTGRRRHRKRTENECCILETNHFENKALGKTSRKKVALGLKYVNLTYWALKRPQEVQS